MKTKRAGVKAILNEIERSSERSPLFHWMVEHRDEILAAAKGRRLMWAELCATLNTLGLTNQRGKAETAQVAR